VGPFVVYRCVLRSKCIPGLTRLEGQVIPASKEFLAPGTDGAYSGKYS
jgi:hypothetical protein